MNIPKQFLFIKVEMRQERQSRKEQQLPLSHIFQETIDQSSESKINPHRHTVQLETSQHFEERKERESHANVLRNQVHRNRHDIRI